MLIRFPHPLLLLAAAALLAAGALTACGPKTPPDGPPDPAVSAVAAADVRWRLHTSLRQSAYLRLDLPVILAGTRITLSDPVLLGARPLPPDAGLLDAVADTQPAPPTADPAPGRIVDWEQLGGELVLSTSRIVRGSVEGPLVDQLTGQPRTTADAGSYLVPLPPAPPAPSPAAPPAAQPRTFLLADPMPLYLKISVPPGAQPGEYRFGMTIEPPGRPPEQVALALTVSELAIPTEPRVLAVMTTTMARLATLYPDTFGAVAVNYLDRGPSAQPEQQAAVEQLDALIRAARREGMALFVEDLTPQVRVDEHGLVTVDWDAYDRVMAPFMEGAAFPDRIPQGVWLAPVPPRRIRDSATQLWQYINACARHFSDRGWVGTPVFFHPALAETAPRTPLADRREDDALRARVVEMMRLHMPREMLAVTTPDISSAVSAPAREPARGTPGATPASTPAATNPASPNISIPHGQLWVVGHDTDPRLPPAAALASESSVRVWPWLCIARGGTISAPGVKGFIWRDALAASSDLKSGGGGGGAGEGGDDLRSPLLIIDTPNAPPANAPPKILPSLRMTWLLAGLNDAALLGLLEKRSDPAIVNEVLAGIVGRTGLRDEPPASYDAPVAPTGYLYAGWPTDRATWAQVTPMLERLILAHDPGQAGAFRQDDPLYLAAKVWLAQSRRPVARVGGYDFSLRPGRGNNSIIDARISIFAENPVAQPAEFDFRFASLPGDFDMAPDAAADAAVGASLRRRSARMPPSALGRIELPLAGHVDALLQAPTLERLELTERHGGTSLRLPIRLPIYRFHATDQWGTGSPRPDGNAADWPMDPQLKVFGEMVAGLRYLARPDLLSATLREDGAPATIRWAYDDTFLYLLARCPQEVVSDERNTEWPLAGPARPDPDDAEGRAAAGRGRWWGGDGLQVQLSNLPPRPAPDAPPPSAAPRTILQVAFKPAGVLLIRTGTTVRAPDGSTRIDWRDGPPPLPASSGNAAPGIRYGITIEKREGRTAGYLVEAAIPRAWVGGAVEGIRFPAWRANILRHRAHDLASMSWSGPLVDDEDIAMMGLLIGE